MVHVRLDVLEEHPEERTGFRHPELIDWIKANRPRLVTVALTILAAYFRAGRPRQNLPPFGSFEGWSRVVREAVVWVGLSDRVAHAHALQKRLTPMDAVGQLIGAWRQFDTNEDGIVAADLLAYLYPTATCEPTCHPTVSGQCQKAAT